MAKNLLDCCLESIGAVSFYQWCFAPLRGRAIDKTCHLRFWVITQSIDGACSRLSLCCRPCLVWRAVAVIAVRAYMVVRDIGEFLHGLVQFLICSEFIELGTFILQGVEVPFHWRIVVWVSGFAHALCHMDVFAEFYESLRCILAPLVAVQEQASLCRMLGIQCLLQGAYSQLTGNVFVCYTCDYAPVIEIYDGAIVPYIPVPQEQVCEVRTPFLVRPVCMEILIQFVIEYFMGLPCLCPRSLWADDGMQAQFPVHVFMDCCLAVAVPPALQIGSHTAVPVYSTVAVVDLFDLFPDFLFLGIVIRLPVFPVVIVGIRADPQPPQQPADAEFLMVLVDEPVSL